MHDIGKVGIVSTLNACRNIKLDRNSPEFEIIKKHTLIGEAFFQNMQVPTNGNLALSRMAQMAKLHHERPDGKGYPIGLSNGQIPIFASVIAVVDSLAAMTGPERSYRAGMTLDAAIAEIKRGTGTQFDQHVVSVLIEMLAAHDKIV